jgi:hypothetical protein
MPEQSPLTLGMTPPLLRGLVPSNAKLSQAHGMALLKRIAEWIDSRVPALRVVITEGTGNMTIYCELTHGRGA